MGNLKNYINSWKILKFGQELKYLDWSEMNDDSDWFAGTKTAKIIKFTWKTPSSYMILDGDNDIFEVDILEDNIEYQNFEFN